MTAAWLEGMRRYIERRFEGSEVSVYDYALGDVFHGVMLKESDGRKHFIAVMPDDWPKDIADSLEDGMRAGNEARRMR